MAKGSRGGKYGSGSGVNESDLVEIARTTTFATTNNRDIVRRLMGTSKSFKGLTFSQAMEQFRTYEREGLVRRGDGWIAVYHDTADPIIRRKKKR